MVALHFIWGFYFIGDWTHPSAWLHHLWFLYTVISVFSCQNPSCTTIRLNSKWLLWVTAHKLLKLCPKRQTEGKGLVISVACGLSVADLSSYWLTMPCSALCHYMVVVVILVDLVTDGGIIKVQKKYRKRKWPELNKQKLGDSGIAGLQVQLPLQQGEQWAAE